MVSTVGFSGTVATFIGTGAAQNASALSATIDWGDGSAIDNGTVTGSGSSIAVSGIHGYASAGSYTTTISVGPAGNPGAITVTGTALVIPLDADLAITAGISPDPVPGLTAAGAPVSFAVPTATDDGHAVPVSCDHHPGDVFPLGTTTVRCTAIDPDDANGSPPGTVRTSFTVTVNGALVQLRDLQTYATGLGAGNSLSSKVALAITYYGTGDYPSTCTQLTSIATTAALQSGKKMTAEQANVVVTSASRIRSVIGC